MTERISRSIAPAMPVTAVRPRLREQERLKPERAPRPSGGTDDMRMDRSRIEAIKQAIAEGRYPVDVEKIAARVAELDLFSE